MRYEIQHFFNAVRVKSFLARFSAVAVGTMDQSQERSDDRESLCCFSCGLMLLVRPAWTPLTPLLGAEALNACGWVRS
jgi:hypothetical protein